LTRITPICYYFQIKVKWGGELGGLDPLSMNLSIVPSADASIDKDDT